VAAKSFSCASCNALNTAALEETIVLVCKNCGALVVDKASAGEKISPSPVPDDWSFIHVGTTGSYAENEFTVVGRVRLQLRNDYKNFWCAALNNGKHLWLMESFGSFAMLGSAWSVFQGKANKLHARSVITVQKDVKVRGEYVEKCEGISYEGEIGMWKLFYPGFFFMQMSNNKNHTAVFTVSGREVMEYLIGSKVAIEKLNLKNILAWDEWK